MEPKKSDHTSVNEELIKKGSEVLKDFDEASEQTYVPKHRGSRLISIRLPISMIDELKRVALQKGVVSYQKLIKTFVQEGLRQSTDAPMVTHAVATIFATTTSPLISVWDTELSRPVETGSERSKVWK